MHGTMLFLFMPGPGFQLGFQGSVAKRSVAAEPRLCVSREGWHVTSRRLLRATTHPLARLIVSNIKSSVSFQPPAAPKIMDR